MSYEEKGTWVYLLAGAGSYFVYVIVLLGRVGDGALVDVPFKSAMLWAVGVAVVLSVVGRVVVEIVKPGGSFKRDVRDREIHRFGEYVGGVVLGVGMVGPFVLVLAEAGYFWVANAMYAVFVSAAVVASATKLVSYRRGL
ncbi:hypothetical protein FHS29_005509 [Saccharothrix tamanrassetensis]|uniref:Uncharacterized protein n=1 Tax=Saccharothrix tamanrassetensis TaxID=1051531 RepID=A0A841CP06_9PSEU|nr:hypothetical protein [Saccharothrix tamanrassetensis]MBB5958900.1 hypothetical protein [Saccharothrix tamanrassetensis]